MATKATNEKRCAAMTINPYAAGATIFVAYPHLKEVCGEVVGVDINKFFRFLALVYDYKSPFVADYPDLQERKEKAAEEVGFILPHAEDKQQRQIAIKFLQKILKNRLWTLICSNEATFDEFTEKVNTPLAAGVDDNDEEALKAIERKGKLLTMMNEILERLDVLNHKFFGGDKSLEAEGRNENFSPEHMARMTRK